MNRFLKIISGNKNYPGRRYLIFLTGLFICSLGVACTTKAGLGTSPVAAIPYSLALVFDGLSFGSWLILFCMVQILAQIVMLGRRCVPSELVIQTVLAFAYGYLTDFSMLLLQGVELESYGGKLAFLLLGCVILAFGVYLELTGDVGMLSGDAFIKAIAQVTGRPYSSVKIVTDVSMSLLAAGICLSFLQRMEGVREGTILAAFLVGMIIRKFQKWFGGIFARLLPEC